MIANDHFNTFFMNNFPTFAIGVTEAAYGPNDQTKMPHYDFAVQASLASHMLKTAMDEGFDFSVTQEFGVDHAMLVPLHYLTDDVKTPVVPIWVNTFSAPLPTAKRCYALGKMMQGAIESLPQKMRVGGDRDRQLLARDRRAEDRSRQAQQRARSRMVEAPASPHRQGASSTRSSRRRRREQMWKAGNIGGELLNWMVLLGMVGKEQAALSRRPRREGRPRLCRLAVELSESRSG